MKKYKCLFWDLDGTITQSLAGVSSALDLTLKHYGINIDKSIYRTFVGPPLKTSLGIYFSGEKLLEVIKYFGECYHKDGLYQGSLFDGIEEVLKKIKLKGYKMYVATSKGETDAINVLNHYKVLDVFDRVFGADHSLNRVEKEDVLEFAFKNIDFKKEDCLMIGDTMYDVNGANYVGIDCLACLYGYGDKDKLLKSNIVSSVIEPLQLNEIL